MNIEGLTLNLTPQFDPVSSISSIDEKPSLNLSHYKINERLSALIG
jgi:hypothetical protein